MKYDKLCLAAVGLCLFNSHAMADDNNWKHCFVGASASFMETSNQWTTLRFQGDEVNANAGSDDGDDTAAALQFGCNFYESSDWVVGAKITAADNTVNASHFYVRGTGPDNVVSYETDEVYSLVARLGFKASQNGLIYGNLGYTQSSQVYRDVADTPFDFSFRRKTNQNGLLVGIGYEHKLSERFSLFAEYNYTDLGDNRVELQDLIAAPTEYSARIDQDIAQFQLGINVLF